jgi:hypothetical protein
MALLQQPTGEAKTLCSAWHRQKGTAALSSGYAAVVRQSSWTKLRRTVVGGGGAQLGNLDGDDLAHLDGARQRLEKTEVG